MWFVVNHDGQLLFSSIIWKGLGKKILRTALQTFNSLGDSNVVTLTAERKTHVTLHDRRKNNCFHRASYLYI